MRKDYTSPTAEDMDFIYSKRIPYDKTRSIIDKMVCWGCMDGYWVPEEAPAPYVLFSECTPKNRMGDFEPNPEELGWGTYYCPNPSCDYHVSKHVKERYFAMTYKLFVDDERIPAKGTYVEIPKVISSDLCGDLVKSAWKAAKEYDWIVARSVRDFDSCLYLLGMPSEVAFDHDLSLAEFPRSEFFSRLVASYAEKRVIKDTGYECAKILIENHFSRELSLEDFPETSVHSGNSRGKRDIEQLIEGYKRRIGSLNHE